MPGFESVRHHSPVHMSNALMPKTHPKDGNRRVRDHLRTVADILRLLRSTWSRRDHDIVELAQNID